MKNNFILLVSVFFLILFEGCNLLKDNTSSPINDLECKSDLKIEYETNRKLGEYGREKNKVRFVFLSDYHNDDIEVYVNDSLYFSKRNLIQDTSNDLSTFFDYKFLNDEEKPLILFKSSKRDNCCKFKLKKGYRIVYVFYYQDYWIIRYSNIEYPLE
ncbi:hypothetical protein [Flavobacterium rhizosphaerae]|uniref:Lipoprotein n=1 Tax=Flavobacterium rhizosphaerae TaxID=3163298 RepID=A0ABW8YZN5_9FLAO